MDIVYIHGLEIKTVIGIFDWEREIKQSVTIDLEMGADIRKAAWYALRRNGISIPFPIRSVQRYDPPKHRHQPETEEIAAL